MKMMAEDGSLGSNDSAADTDVQLNDEGDAGDYYYLMMMLEMTIEMKKRMKKE